MPVAAGGAIAAWAAAAGATAATTAMVGAIATAAVTGALVGGAIGAATSLMSGGNIIEGTLKGALIGGITGGAASYLSGAATVAGAAAEAAEAAAVGGNISGGLTAAEATAAAELGAGVSADVGTSATANLPGTASAGTQAPGLITSAGGGVNQSPVTPTGLINTGDSGLSGYDKLVAEMGKDRAAMVASQNKALYLNTAAQALGGAFQAKTAKEAAEEQRESNQELIASRVSYPGGTLSTQKTMTWKDILARYKLPDNLKAAVGYQTKVSKPLYQKGLLTGGA